jgi:hypothetical protein
MLAHAALCFGLLVFNEPAPAPAPVPEPADPPSQSRDLTGGFASPSAIEFQTSTVHRPRYGLGIESVAVDRGPEQFQLAPKTWNEIVRDDPDLLHLHRKGRLLGGGIALTAVGGSWLMLSTALAMDGHYSRTAVGGLFQWVMPAGLFAGGAIMTVVAVRARRRLREEQRRLFAAPYASAGQTGVMVSGRF